MPAVEREFAFDIDVQKWSKDWKPQSKKKDQNKVGVKEVGCFSATGGKIVPNSRKNLFGFNKPRLNSTLQGNDYEEFRKQTNNSRPWKFLEPHRLCNIDVRRYDIIAGREILVHLGTALYECKNSFAIKAVALGDGHPVFLLLDRKQNSQKIGPQDLHTVVEKLYAGKESEKLYSDRENEKLHAGRENEKLRPGRKNEKLYAARVNKDKKELSIGADAVLLDEVDLWRSILLQDDLPLYFGSRFEAVCTNRDKVTNDQKFCSLVKHNIGGHQVLLTAEVDCRDGAKSKKSPMNYIELKCRLEADNDNRYMHKYMRYWLQSYLAGVPRIVEGVRDNEGKLLRLEEFETSKIPEVCKQYRKSLGKGWNDTKILDFLAMALTKISKLCRKNPETVVQVKFDCKKRQLTAKLISNHGTAKVLKRELEELGSHMENKKKGKVKSKSHEMKGSLMHKEMLQFDERVEVMATRDILKLENFRDASINGAEQRLSAPLISNCERAKLRTAMISQLGSHLHCQNCRRSSEIKLQKELYRVPVEYEQVQVRQEQMCWPLRLLKSCWLLIQRLFSQALRQV